MSAARRASTVVRAEVDPQHVVAVDAALRARAEIVGTATECGSPRTGRLTTGQALAPFRRESAHSASENLTGSPPMGWSLRSGCPSQSSSIRRRRRFGCPSKRIPIRSNCSRSCQSAVGHTATTLSTDSPSSSQHLEPHPDGELLQRKQVVADGEALRLHLGKDLQSLRRREVDVAPVRRRDVTGDALAAPVQVVRSDEVAEHVEAELVACVRARFADARRLDRDRRLAERFLLVDEAGKLAVAHVATCLRAHAGATPAWYASWSRMIPSISASGRGGQNGT